MELFIFLTILAIGIIGGFFNTFMGAGSLLTIPVLIVFGLPPHVAIATNRLGVIGSDIAGWYSFHRQGLIDYRAAFTLAVPCLAGAVIGANLVLEVNESILRIVIACITLAILSLIVLQPEAGILRSQERLGKGRRAFAIAAGFFIGVYGGFYGAGAGTFLFYILILFFGQTFIESAGTHEPANLGFSLMAATIFAYKGLIEYIWVLPLFLGSFVGSYLSAHYADKIGNLLLRRLFVAVVLIVAIKLVFDM